jgi:hypothetical protein
MATILFRTISRPLSTIVSSDIPSATTTYQQRTGDDYTYYIKQVIIFGSYLSDNPTLGDIDLSLILELRDDDPQEGHKHFDGRIKLGQKQGRHFKNVFDRASWPYQEVIQFLKNRSPSLSLHDEKHEEVLSRDIPSKMIFDISETQKREQN